MPITPADLIRDPIQHYPAATVAAFDATTGNLPRRQLDHVRNKKFIEQLAQCEVPAILIGASTGHGHLRTPAELEEWMHAASDADWKSTLKMILLRPEDGDAASEQLVSLSADLGYSVVFVRPGTNLGRDATETEIVDNVKPIIEKVARRGLAVGVYSIPDVSGVRLTPDATIRLLSCPGGDSIVAVKITEGDYEKSTLDYLRRPELARLKIVQGWDPHLAAALQDGPRFDKSGRQRCGVTSGPMSFAVHQYRHLLSAAGRGEWSEVEMAQQAVTQLFAAMQDDPSKFADLQRAKSVMGLGQPLLGTVTFEQVTRLFNALEMLPRDVDRRRLARSLNLMGDGAFAARLHAMSGVGNER